MKTSAKYFGLVVEP